MVVDVGGGGDNGNNDKDINRDENTDKNVAVSNH